jgi:hypothetical protein
MRRTGLFGAVMAAVVAGSAAMVAHGAGQKEQGGFISPDTPVRGHPDLTYADLVRSAVPDLATNTADGTLQGHLAKTFRHVAGHDYEGDQPDPVTLNLVEDQRIVVGGRRRIAILAELGPDPDRAYDTALLMLFDDSPRPKLLDAVDVGVDKDTSLSEHPILKLGPGDDALVTYSEHFNSNQTYANWLIVMARGDRLTLVDQFFALQEGFCGWRSEQDPTFSTRPDKGRPYWRIDVAVRDVITHEKEDCGDEKQPKAHVRVWRDAYRWNAAVGRYESSGALKRLDKINFDRVNAPD